MTDLQRQYEGYYQTPLLWDEELFGLSQLDFEPRKNQHFSKLPPKGIRLGHLVEHFVHFDLSNDAKIEVMANNVQIHDSRTTLGEIDFLIQRNNHLYQIETSYKFYLWDDSFEHKGIRKWIGPNRKDALHLKLEKIVHSQFPLIRNEFTIKHLKDIGISDENIQQRVYFKAQLFVPFEKQYQLEGLNEACVTGFYVRLSDIDLFVDEKFYVPSKYDWLTIPHTNVEWMDISSLKEAVSLSMGQKQSVLIWKKTTTGNLSKFFLVWWN